MGYIGNTPALKYASFAVQHFTTSATTTYTLDNPVANENEIALFINNVRQEPGSSYAYTASGTTLTLSAATSASDTMYCVFIGKAVQTVTPASGSVTGDMMSYPLTNFSSTGIDDNATSTAYTIESDGDIHIAKTSRADNTVGHTLASDGLAVHTRDNAELLFLNRKTSDGKIISVRKDNTEEGNIGVSGGDMYIASSTSGHKGFRFGNGAIVPSNTSGGTDDNATTLGGATQRFADLYLGGSVYLGGTGSANALDDYEEGTWTPTQANMNVSGTFSASGRYVKVGKMVLAYGTFSATGSIAYDGSGLIGSFPFQGAVTDNGTATYVSLSGNTASGGIGLGDFISSRFFFKDDFTTTGANQKTTFHAVYEANS